jgi:hypothetical protein
LRLGNVFEPESRLTFAFNECFHTTQDSSGERGGTAGASIRRELKGCGAGEGSRRQNTRGDGN